MQIAAVLFPRLTALDIVGPYEVLQRLPGAVVVFVGHEVGTVRTENGFLGLSVDAVFEDVIAPDVVVVPGGYGSRALMHDERVLDWLRAVHPTTTYTTSVCTGSLVLGAAGLLQGLTATTHWSVLNDLEPLGATPTSAAGGRAPRPADHHRRRRVVGHRHGAAPERAARRRRGGAGHAAHGGVRPAAAVRLRLAGQGVARGARAGHRVRRVAARGHRSPVLTRASLIRARSGRSSPIRRAGIRSRR